MGAGRHCREGHGHLEEMRKKSGTVVHTWHRAQGQNGLKHNVRMYTKMPKAETAKSAPISGLCFPFSNISPSGFQVVIWPKIMFSQTSFQLGMVM